VSTPVENQKEKRNLVPAVDSSFGLGTLPFLLSVIAGATDVISFLGRLFTAHITGNLVILAAHIVSGGSAPLAPMLSVPIFIIALGLTCLFAAGLEAIGVASLRPLLLLQSLLLFAFLALCVAAGAPRSSPILAHGSFDANAAIAVVAGMLGVSAMAVQNAMVHGAPATAVMTTNITLLTIDVGNMLIARDPKDVAKARSRARHTWPAVVGFAIGCTLGASCEMIVGLRSLALPAGFAVLALALGRATR